MKVLDCQFIVQRAVSMWANRYKHSTNSRINTPRVNVAFRWISLAIVRLRAQGMSEDAEILESLICQEGAT